MLCYIFPQYQWILNILREGILKKILFTLFFVLTGMGAFCANYTDLTDRDEGALLVNRRTYKVYVFKKSTGNGFWQCTLFRENHVENLAPKDCLLLDTDEYSITPEEVAINYVYYSNRATWNRPKCAAYKNIARKMNSSAIMQVLTFEMELKKLAGKLDEKVIMAANIERSAKMLEWADRVNNAARNVKTSKNSFNKCPTGKVGNSADKESNEAKLELLVEDIGFILEKNECAKLIRGTADVDGNYFTACSMYMKYYEMLRKTLAPLGEEARKEFTLEALALGKELLKKYQQQRDKNKKRESDFKNLCPDVHGAWEYASALSMREMQRSMKSFFTCYQNLKVYSFHTEFPKWGNCALEVMQMIESPELEKKFDAALKAYQKRVSP